MKVLNKKSQIETQFNWMYVLIIGSVLFGFIVYFGFQIKASSDVSYCNDLVKTVLDNVANSNYKSNSFSVLKMSLNNDIQYDGYSMFCKGSQGRNIQNVILFSQDSLVKTGSQKDILILTLPYYKPFFITNINFLIDSNSKFVLRNDIYGQVVTDYLLQQFPDKRSAIENVFKSTSYAQKGKYDKAYCINTYSSGSFVCDSTMTLTEQQLSDMSELDLLTLILSNPSVMDIQQKKMLDKLSLSTSIYLAKCEAIKTAYDADIVCKYDHYIPLCGNLTAMQTAISSVQNYADAVSSVNLIARKIDAMNSDTPLDSCVYLY